jgi:hypothetical protein
MAPGRRSGVRSIERVAGWQCLRSGWDDRGQRSERGGCQRPVRHRHRRQRRNSKRGRGRRGDGPAAGREDPEQRTTRRPRWVAGSTVGSEHSSAGLTTGVDKGTFPVPARGDRAGLRRRAYSGGSPSVGRGVKCWPRHGSADDLTALMLDRTTNLFAADEPSETGHAAPADSGVSTPGVAGSDEPVQDTSTGTRDDAGAKYGAEPTATGAADGAAGGERPLFGVGDDASDASGGAIGRAGGARRHGVGAARRWWSRGAAAGCLAAVVIVVAALLHGGDEPAPAGGTRTHVAAPTVDHAPGRAADPSVPPEGQRSAPGRRRGHGESRGGRRARRAGLARDRRARQPAPRRASPKRGGSPSPVTRDARRGTRRGHRTPERSAAPASAPPSRGASSPPVSRTTVAARPRTPRAAGTPTRAVGSGGGEFDIEG